MNRSIRQPTLLDTGKLVLLGAIWGSAFLCIDIALEGFPPLTLAGVRLFLGAATLGLIAWGSGQALPRDAQTWALLVLIGFLNGALPFALISWGQQYISGGRSAVLMATGPFVALSLSHYLSTDDRFTTQKLGGMVLGFAGVGVLVGPDVTHGPSGPLLGQIAVMTAAACYATSAVFTRRVAHVPPLMNSALVLATASSYMLPLALLLDRPWILEPKLTPSVALLFLGLVPTALAYLLRFQLVQGVGAVFMSQVSYLVPLFAVLWGWLFLGQVPLQQTWLALMLILAGVYISRVRRV